MATMSHKSAMTGLTVSVFAVDEQGGNPCTIMIGNHSADEMTALASSKGHECCLAERTGERAYHLRFFAPTGEMDMCAHASVGAAWILGDAGGEELSLACAGGLLRATVAAGGKVSISQPKGRVDPVNGEAALVALGLADNDLVPGRTILNGTSTRTKTMVPLANITCLQLLDPDPDAVKRACDHLGSTGLYPWVEKQPGCIEARQFPNAAGYREDPATGVAAAALFFALGSPRSGLQVFQGRAMGRLSSLRVSTDPAGDGCLLTGTVRRSDPRENSRLPKDRGPES